MLDLENAAYSCGQAEARLNIVPGLMPEAYILGRLDAKTKKHPDKNKPGFDWVEDPSVKNGGYYRKTKSSAGSTVAKVAAAVVLAGAGAAAIANRKPSTTAPPRSSSPVPLPTTPTVAPITSKLNKKAVAAAGVVGAAGVSAIAANRMQNARSVVKPPSPESKMPTGAKVQYRQVPDPWSSSPDVSDPWNDAPKTASGASPAANPQNAQLPPARYVTRSPQEPDPWEAETSNNKAMSEQSSVATAMPDTLSALPPAKPVIYKRPFVAKTRKLRETINLAKREQTGLAKAKESLELGQRLQEKTNSPADVRRGLDVEMNASERIANIQARSPARTPAGVVTIRGKNRNSVRANETAEESKSRKKKELDREKLLAESQALLDETVPTLETKPEGRLVRSPLENKLTRQKVVKGTVEVAKDIIETGNLPSRAEIANFAGYAAGSTVKRAIDLSKEKNPIEAAKQLIEEGNERERKVREIVEKAGIDIPSRGDIIYNAGLKIGDPLVAAAEKGVELITTPDGIVNTAGFLASKAGAATGIPGAALALDLGGALVMRKAVTDVDAVKRAYKQLKNQEAYITAKPIDKIQQLAKLSIGELETAEAQAKLKDDFLADKTGWAIGNTVAETVPIPVPFKGAAVALVTVPTVTDKIKNQGVLKTAVNLPVDTIRAIQTLPGKMQEPTIRGNKREEEARVKFKSAVLTSKKRLKQANTVRKLIKKERRAKRVITKTQKNIKEAREIAARLNKMKKRSFKTDSNVPNGQIWVKDLRKKRGGYWRQTRKGIKKVGGAIASQLLGTAVVGTGAALVTHHALKTGKKQARIAANDVAQKFGKQVNKTAIAGTAIGGLAVGAAGTAAIASRRKRTDAAVTIAREKFKQSVQSAKLVSVDLNTKSKPQTRDRDRSKHFRTITPCLKK